MVFAGDGLAVGKQALKVAVIIQCFGAALLELWLEVHVVLGVMFVIFIGGKYYLLILLMAKANSFKTEPWTALEKGEVSIFEDDYVHDKLFTLKATRKAAASSVALKETLTQKDGKITSADELKFWFPFRGTRTLYARIKNDGFKLHYDHGVLTQNDYRFNLYSSVQGKRNFGSLVYKLGLETQNNDLLFNWRLRYSQGESLNLANKTTYTQPKWSLGLVNSFDLTAQQWNHSAAQLAWKHSNINFYLKANGNGSKKYERVNPRTFLETISFHAIEKLTDNTKLGLELSGNLIEQEVTNAAVAWDHRCASTANTGIRVKADLKRNLSFSIKNSLHDYGSYIFGVHVHEFGGANRFSYGVQLDLTL